MRHLTADAAIEELRAFSILGHGRTPLIVPLPIFGIQRPIHRLVLNMDTATPTIQLHILPPDPHPSILELISDLLH